MLNASNQRMLAYIEKVTAITPIEKADRLEAVHINGWVCVCGKGEFKEGDVGVFFEIDSKLPEIYPFTEMEFLVNKKYKIKSQKIRGQISQGLFMPLSAFENGDNTPTWVDSINFRIQNGSDVLHEDLTAVIGVTYAVEEDNKRKAPSVDKYKKMSQRHPQVFRQPWARWMMKREWGRKVMFFFFGKKKDKKSGWPNWVTKTDEERVQNMTWILEDKEPWIATEKIDGSSTTATYRKTGKRKHVFYICSRNVVFDKPDKKCFYETNIYTEMAEKYNFEEVLEKIVEKYNLEWATLQGETYGAGVQKREYSLKGHDFMGFNLIFSDRGRLNSVEAKEIMSEYGIPWVPIVDENFILPDTLEELLDIATNKSQLDGGMREGLVFRSQDGVKSFKAVSNEFLLKYHQ